MPAALVLKSRFSRLQHVQPAWFVGGAALVLFGVGSVLLGNTSTAVAGSAVHPLYPSVQSPVDVIDVPRMTVTDVIQKLPITLRFNMLLVNSGVMSELTQDGFYTLFVPADNYFDYLPRGAYASLTKDELASLAQYHVQQGVELTPKQALSDKYIILKAYKAKNGMVYVINRILIPDDLKQQLQN